jgi:hypothetical protein
MAPGDRVLIEFDRRRPDESVWLGRPVLGGARRDAC